jgi:hypothetical protein
MQLESIMTAGRQVIMGSVHDVQPVRLIASLLTKDLTLLEETKIALSASFGPIDYESDVLPFDHSDYYGREFGANLQRVIVAFEQLVDPGDLPAIKHRTNELEQATSHDGKRRVNIDPGYVSLGKMVLATTKDHAHRLYLGQGIYGEGTLVYQRGAFRPWPWSYPDYASERYCTLFQQIRTQYKEQLRQLEGQGTTQAGKGIESISR